MKAFTVARETWPESQRGSVRKYHVGETGKRKPGHHVTTVGGAMWFLCLINFPGRVGTPREPHIRFPKCLHTFTSESEIICLRFTYPSQLLRILCCWFSVINTRRGLSGQPCGWSCALGGSRRPGGPLFTFLNPAAGTRPGPATSAS